MRFLPALLLAAPAAAQLVPAPGTSLFHADVSADHAFVEVVSSLAPGLGVAALAQEFPRGPGEPDLRAVSLALNHLAWRRNTADSQANLVLSAGPAALDLEGSGREPGASVGFQLDWETRRLHAALIGHGLLGDGLAQGELMVHAGFAPWTSSYEEIAPWLLLEVSRTLGREAETEVAPVLVLMYQAYRLELGVNGDGHPRAALRWIF